MIFILTSSDSIRLVTSAAGQVDVTVSWGDFDTTTFLPSGVSGADFSITTAATTTVVAAPTAGNSRLVRGMSIRNAHATVVNTVTLQRFNGTTAREGIKVTLAVGETILIDADGGYLYLDNAGRPKSSSVSSAVVSDGAYGDITITGGVWAIPAATVSLSKMADIQTSRFIGRTTAGIGVPESLTIPQVTAMLAPFTNTLQGVVPGSGGGTTNFMRADGSWAAPVGTVTTFLDGTFTLQNTTDATKQGKFSLAGNTTATTRTYILPDLNNKTFFMADGGAQTITGSTTFSAQTAYIGTSTLTQTLNFGTSALASAQTRDINIGNSGLLGSTTTVSIATSGAVGSQNDIWLGSGAGTGTLRIQTPTVNFLSGVTSLTMMDGALRIQNTTDATKVIAFDASPITTGTTRTYSMPNASGTLALNTTFTNALQGLVPASGGGTANFMRADGSWAAPAGGGSTFIDNVFTIQDDLDNTKQLRLQLAGLTTATTRTLTVPDASDTIATLAATQTLTNKSIVATQLTGTLQAAQFPAQTGDVTNVAGSLAMTIAAGAVTLAKQANIATGSIMGRTTALAGVQEVLTPAQAKTVLAIASSDVSGLGSLATASSVSLTTQATGTLQAAQEPAHTGDVTNAAGSLALTIAANAVTAAQFQQISTNTILGRTSALTGNVQVLTGTQVTAMLDNFTSALKGLVPASGGGTTNFMRADGSWAAPGGGGGSTFLDGVFRVQNTTDTTKQVALDASLITTATTRTLTAPDASGTIALLGLAQTFTATQVFQSPSNTFGAGTGTGTINIGTGATASGNVKSLNIGINGASGSTTTITIGSTFGTTTTINGTLVIPAGTVSLAGMANLAANSIIGNNTGVGAVPLALTGTQVTAMLDNFTSALKGLVPASGGGTTNFMRADGSWALPPSASSTFLDGTFTLQNTTDATKQGKFSLAGNTTATTRTYTLPDSTGTLAILEQIPLQTFLGNIDFNGANVKFGSSTVTGTIYIGGGSLATGQTRTIGIGIAGAAGSTTDVTIGSLLGSGSLSVRTPTVTFGSSVTSLTMMDGALRIQNTTDATKQLALDLSGFTTGTTRTFVLPNASDTIATLAATQTLTNKSIAATQLTGTLQAAQFPAQTGDVTNTAGSLATTIAAGAVTLAKQANIATGSIMGRTTALAGVQEVLTPAQAKTVLAIDAADVTNVVNRTTAQTIGGAKTFSVPVVLTGQTTDPASPADGTVWFDSQMVTQKVVIGGRSKDLFADFVAGPYVWKAAPGAATIAALGLAAPTAVGTAFAANIATTNKFAMMPRLEYLVTVAAPSAVAGFRGTTTVVAVGGTAADLGGFRCTMVWGPATGVATTTTRAWFGLSNVTAAPTDVEPSTQLTGVGMGWDAADTQIQMMFNDGAGSATKVALGASFPRPTVDRTSVYKLEMYSPKGTTQSVQWRVTDLVSGAVAQGTATTKLPTTSTLMCPRGWMSVGGTSSVIGVMLTSMYLDPLL